MLILVCIGFLERARNLSLTHIKPTDFTHIATHTSRGRTMSIHLRLSLSSLPSPQKTWNHKQDGGLQGPLISGCRVQGVCLGEKALKCKTGFQGLGSKPLNPKYSIMPAAWMREDGLIREEKAVKNRSCDNTRFGQSGLGF